MNLIILIELYSIWIVYNIRGIPWDGTGINCYCDGTGQTNMFHEWQSCKNTTPSKFCTTRFLQEATHHQNRWQPCSRKKLSPCTKSFLMCTCQSRLTSAHIWEKQICLKISGVQDPGFGVQSGQILRIFWILEFFWNFLDEIGYRFRFNRIRNRLIQMKKTVAMQKTWYRITAVSGKITIFRNHISNKLIFLFLSENCNVTCRSGSSLSDWEHLNSHATCSLELREDEHVHYHYIWIRELR